ncbi:MAG: DUF4434 domain-containing protein [Negativicutes bacterium]|nr:DUF4434 domain-containing protein [Negativicutes bacterium]
MRITATFLDEISHDIPDQNWGEEDWDADFAAMQTIGIDTVVLIRCGYRRWQTFPSRVLSRHQNCHTPPADLVDMFLRLAEKYQMQFWFGLYDSGELWHTGRYREEVDLNRQLIEEVWEKYGSRKAFKGWYISHEVSRRLSGIIDTYRQMGEHAKHVSGGLPVLISPYIDGVKAIDQYSSAVSRSDGITLIEHEAIWQEIMQGIRNCVDIVAFQDGHVDFHELADYIAVNKRIADANGLRSWSNCESFDRDMPIKFLPIKWEKMLLKLNAAARCGVEKVITFEFSHFMSPNSAYWQARNLYRRYRQFFSL